MPKNNKKTRTAQKKVDYAKLNGSKVKMPLSAIEETNDDDSSSSCSDDVVNGLENLNISPGCSSCKSLMSLVQQLIEEVTDLKKEISSIKEQRSMDQQVVASKQFMELKKEVEEQIEDRTNRQLRKTLVFQDIVEAPDEKTWKDTKEVLADRIGKALNISHEKANSIIDRCHRGGNKKFYLEKNKCRPTFAAMHKWDDCEDICQVSRRTKHFNSDYKYGPKFKFKFKFKSFLVIAFAKIYKINSLKKINSNKVSDS